MRNKPAFKAHKVAALLFQMGFYAISVLLDPTWLPWFAHDLNVCYGLACVIWQHLSAWGQGQRMYAWRWLRVMFKRYRRRLRAGQIRFLFWNTYE